MLNEKGITSNTFKVNPAEQKQEEPRCRNCSNYQNCVFNSEEHIITPCEDYIEIAEQKQEELSVSQRLSFDTKKDADLCSSIIKSERSRHEKEREELKEIIRGLIELKDEYLKESENHEKELCTMKEINDIISIFKMNLKNSTVDIAPLVDIFNNAKIIKIVKMEKRVFGGEKNQ